VLVHSYHNVCYHLHTDTGLDETIIAGQSRSHFYLIEYW